MGRPPPAAHHVRRRRRGHRDRRPRARSSTRSTAASSTAGSPARPSPCSQPGDSCCWRSSWPSRHARRRHSCRLSMFRRRTALTASTLVSGAGVQVTFLATIYQGTLYLQQVLGYSAIATGVAWLASDAQLAGGGRWPGRAAGRALRSRAGAHRRAARDRGGRPAAAVSPAPADAAYWRDLFPCFIAIGVGIGSSAVAVQVAAFTGVEPAVSGPGRRHARDDPRGRRRH